MNFSGMGPDGIEQAYPKPTFLTAFTPGERWSANLLLH